MTPVSIVITVSSLNRVNELTILADSISSQNYSNINVVLVNNGIRSDFSAEAIFPGIDLIQVHSNINKGVAGGRNLGIKKATGDYIVFIDDDASFATESAVSDIVSLFYKYPDVSAFTFKIKNCGGNITGKNVDHGGYPFRRGKEVENDSECSYFFGGASAFKRDVFDKTGLLTEEYFFGCEELDYSFLMLENGMKIMFSPAVTINHYLCENEERSKNRAYYLIRNRILLAFKFLPIKYALCHSILWTFFIFFESLSDNSTEYFYKGFIEGIRKIPSVRENKKILSREAIKKIKKLRGRLYF